MNNNLDVTLKTGLLIDSWLADWIYLTAKEPTAVRAVITEESTAGKIIELQDNRGIASGGIIFINPEGAVHILGALDPNNEPYTKVRSLKEMNYALNIAFKNKRNKNKCMKFCEICLYGILPVIILYSIYYFFMYIIF